jgi:hypothetical protein
LDVLDAIVPLHGLEAELAVAIVELLTLERLLQLLHVKTRWVSKNT